MLLTRRSSLKTLLATAAPLAAAAQTPTVASRIIDTHTHFYDPTRPEGVPWPGKGSALFRPVYPKDWAALAGKHGIRETVVIEASKWLEDNQWILDLADKEKSIVGFIGHLLPHEAAFSDQLKRFSENAVFRGIRVSGDDLLNHSGSAEFIAGAKLLADLGLTLDVNGLGKDGLTAVAQLAERLPSLRIMVDHCGNCGDAAELTDAWRSGMMALAKRSKVFCKVSALVEMTRTPSGQAPKEMTYYLPVLNHLWESFGPERLVFGSNWPVSDKGASFDVLFSIVSEFFTGKGKDACEAYFWRNAVEAYGLRR
jgi:L-fuconolactonase